MAYTFDTGGVSVSDGALAMFRLKAALVVAGWTVMSSGDGTTYFPASDGITSGGTGAGGLNNVRAWFRIRQPGANAREFVFQRSDFVNVLAPSSYRIKYSGGPTEPFTGGSPSATEVPSATNEQVMLGAGTDASPTFVEILNRATELAFTTVITGGAPEGYMFWFGVNRQSNTGMMWVMYLDPLVAGTFDVLDIDPVVVYLGLRDDGQNFQNYLLSSSDTPGINARGWIGKGIGGGAFKPVSGHGLADFNLTFFFPGSGGTSFYNGKDDFFPLFYGRQTYRALPTGWKGMSSFVLLTSVSRGVSDTFTKVTPKDRILMAGPTATGFVTVPWNGTDLRTT